MSTRRGLDPKDRATYCLVTHRGYRFAQEQLAGASPDVLRAALAEFDKNVAADPMGELGKAALGAIAYVREALGEYGGRRADTDVGDDDDQDEQ